MTLILIIYFKWKKKLYFLLLILIYDLINYNQSIKKYIYNISTNFFIIMLEINKI